MLIETSNVLQRVDLWLYDWETSVLRLRPRASVQDVVLIGIDEHTVRAIPEPMVLWHRHIAKLLEALIELRPAVVGVDMVLPERSYDFVMPGSDRVLTLALAKGASQYPLILGITIDQSGHRRPLLPAFEAAVGSDHIGYVLFPVDADQAVRRFDERLGSNAEKVPTMVGAMTRQLGRNVEHGWINYSIGQPLSFIPMQTLLQAANEGRLESFRAQIQNRAVLVGPVLQFEDRRAQPVNLAAWEHQRSDAPALLLHAQALRSILGPGLIVGVPQLVIAVLAAAMLATWFLRWTLAPLMALALLGLLLLLGGELVALTMGIYAEIALPGLALLLGVGARCGANAAQSYRQRQRLRSALAGYVSSHVADAVVSGRLRSGFEGQRYLLCVIFVDMRNFTPRSEASAPEEVIELVNRCFEEMVTAIHGHGGTVVQFMGDGIEAFFGAPNALENPAQPAFDAICELFSRMRRLNAQLTREGIEPVQIGAGVNLGHAIVGHVGAHSRYGYQPIGDVVNVASRLEGLTKESGFPVVCADSVVQLLKERPEFVSLGLRALKGHSPVLAHGWRPPQI